MPISCDPVTCFAPVPDRTRSVSPHARVHPLSTLARMGAAASLVPQSGRQQQIALSDRFLYAKNPDPTTRFPAAPKTPSLSADPMQNSVEQFQAQVHLVFGDV